MKHNISLAMYLIFVLFSLVCVSWAQIPSFGFCPDYLPMVHFDMNRFLGKWYEAERYFQFSEVASRCVVTDYAVGPNGKIYVSNEVTNRFTGVKRVIGGNLDITGKKTEGRLIVKYDTTPISTTSALTILDTDYDTYAVIWSCSGLGPVNAQSAWLMTRERIPDSTTLQKAYGVLDRYKISRTFFVKTDQEGCAIAASDLNAALGIASTSTNVDQTADVESNRERVHVKAQPVAEILLKREETAPIKLTEESSKDAVEKEQLESEAPAKEEAIVALREGDSAQKEDTNLKASDEIVEKTLLQTEKTLIEEPVKSEQPNDNAQVEPLGNVSFPGNTDFKVDNTVVEPIAETTSTENIPDKIINSSEAPHPPSLHSNLVEKVL